MNLRVNRDGKLWDRVLGASIPFMIGMVPVTFVWWRDASISDTKAAEGLVRVERRMDKLEEAQRAAAEQSAADRQKLSGFAATVENVSKTADRIDRRVETLYDRLVGSPSRP